MKLRHLCGAAALLGLTASSATLGADLIQNGSFEAGSGSDATSWTRQGTAAAGNGANCGTHSGLRVAELGQNSSSSGDGTWSQTFTVPAMTSTNTTAQFSFWWCPKDLSQGGSTIGYQVSVNGSPALAPDPKTINRSDTSDYTQVTETLTVNPNDSVVVTFTNPKARPYVDDVVFDLQQQVCHVLRMVSDNPEPREGLPTPTYRLFGTGLFTITGPSGGPYDLSLKLDEPLVSNGTSNGVVYNNGDFTFETPLNPALWPTEFFPTKNGVQVASPSNLSGLILTSSTGSSTITFGSSTAYTYSHNGGGAFESPHTGTYRTVTCAQAIPSPGSLFLLLSALPVLVSIRRRQTARRRKTVHCAYLDMQVPDGAVPSPHA